MSELKLLVVTASTTLNRVTPSHRFRTHNSVVVGSSPTRPTKVSLDPFIVCEKISCIHSKVLAERSKL
jgi:hypothetical protein